VKEQIRQAQVAAIASDVGTTTPTASPSQAAASVAASNDNGIIPTEGLAGNVAGAFAGLGRFVTHTVGGLVDAGTNLYQSADYLLTGNETSQAGYEKTVNVVTGVVKGTASLVTDSVDTYAYLATGDNKYLPGYQRNEARGDAIIAAAQNWQERYSAASDYEKSAMLSEGLANVAVAVLGTKGLGEVKAVGEVAAVTEEVAGATKALGTVEELAGATKGLGKVEEVAGVAGRVSEGPVQAGEAGRFADLQARSVVGDELEAHHMPQAAAQFTERSEGGALVMTQEEHMATRTYFSKGAAVAREEAGLPFREVLARDISDVRDIVGSKYNEGLQDLIKYYKQNFPTLINKP